MNVLTILFPILLAAAAAPVDYSADVAPVVQKHCAKCHGADKQESGLRLDRRASLLRGGDFGQPAIEVGNSAASFLIQVVSGKNPDVKMPPEGAPLTDAEIALLKAWIDQGAKMPEELSGDDLPDRGDHWSYQPVQAVAPPDVESEFVANPIDAFVLQRLKEKGLSPSPPAERRTLIRRLYLVMHGLPPTPEQIEQFLADESPDAWSHAVDRALASPRYGERWARHWLDLIRFGETHGFETNRERPNAWLFRDYVIQSFNADKPYDQFVREQIAGDALGAPLGTGFLVAGPYDLVKGGGNLGAIQRMNELDDMINATGATFLGLTLGCARCHNHKFDPITQVDYYSLQAIFAGVQHGDAALPPSEAAQSRLAKLQQEIDDLTKKLAKFDPQNSPEGNKQAKRPAVAADRNGEQFPPHMAKYVRFTIAATNSAEPCIDELEIFAEGKNVALATAGAKATASGSLRGYDIHKLEHINDGRFGNSRSWICDKQQGWVQIELAEPAMIDRIEWARDRQRQYADRLAVAYRIESATEVGQWQLIAGSHDRLPYQGESRKPAAPIYEFASFPAQEAEQGRAWLARVDAARAEADQLRGAQQAYIGSFVQPGATHRLHRGEPDQQREVVGPNAVAALTSLDLELGAPEQQRRLELADWIASDDNPLTARVIVNRLWQHHFGEGLVDTPSDFGHNGGLPTHPELLDWMAGELTSHGWSLKHMHRLILTSNTWRQDSRPREQAAVVDATSRLLWRFPPRRLEAEAIRDSVLAVSGALDLRMGGPGFSGFEVEAENVRHFHPKTSYGPDDWRRMIYMTKVRQEQESVFGAFDCPDASQVAPKRSRSTTPLQAFNLFNSAFMLQQSDILAARLEKAEPDSALERARLAYAWAFGRPATDKEAEAAASFAAEQSWPALCRAFLNANEFVFIP